MPRGRTAFLVSARRNALRDRPGTAAKSRFDMAVELGEFFGCQPQLLMLAPSKNSAFKTGQASVLDRKGCHVARFRS